jgi:hypothetical protein
MKLFVPLAGPAHCGAAFRPVLTVSLPASALVTPLECEFPKECALANYRANLTGITALRLVTWTHLPHPTIIRHNRFQVHG